MALSFGLASFGFVLDSGFWILDRLCRLPKCLFGFSCYLFYGTSCHTLFFCYLAATATATAATVTPAPRWLLIDITISFWCNFRLWLIFTMAGVKVIVDCKCLPRQPTGFYKLGGMVWCPVCAVGWLCVCLAFMSILNYISIIFITSPNAQRRLLAIINKL